MNYLDTNLVGRQCFFPMGEQERQGEIVVVYGFDITPDELAAAPPRMLVADWETGKLYMMQYNDVRLRMLSQMPGLK